MVSVHSGAVGIELTRDLDRPDAWALFVDGTPQSHVDLGDPTHLEFEYVRRLGHVVDLVAPEGAPLRALHLGGGALTLARYLAATRPGSPQQVVEIDAALVDLVTRELPLWPGWRLQVEVADARDALATVPAGTVDLLVVDVFAGPRIPAHLTSGEFVTAAAGALAEGGTYAVNVADSGPLDFARAQVATVRSVFGQVCLIVEPSVLGGRRFGNLVLVAACRPLPTAALARRSAVDPFPARVLHGAALARFVGGAAPVTDATATPSPLPPPGSFGVSG